MRSPVTTLLTFGVLISAQLGLAIDPVVVVYSDPSLTRLEKEIGVTPAQKDRFDDIVVKYRDPESSNAAGAKAGGDADSSASPQAGGRGGGGGGVVEAEEVVEAAEADLHSPAPRAIIYAKS